MLYCIVVLYLPPAYWLKYTRIAYLTCWKKTCVPYLKVGDIETEVRKMMKLGVIEPSRSPYCSPLMLVKKSDGTFRPEIDFRQINRVTVFDWEPMPNPDQSLPS